MTEKAKTNKAQSRQKALIWILSIAGVLAITWGTMLYNDYNRVMRQYVKPAFCINFDQAYQDYRAIPYGQTKEEYEVNHARKLAERYIINYGYFQGLGYGVELSGSFLPYNENPPRDEDTYDILNPWPGVLQARFTLFGKEIARVDRPYPEDAGRTEDWQMHQIF